VKRGGFLLLHGFTGGPASWDEVAARLPDEPIRETLAGHGPGLAIPSFAGEVERLAARLRGLPPMHLVGYSLGARVALALLARHPERFSRATLIGAHAGLRDAAARAERAAADARWIDLLERRGIAAFVDAWEAQPLFASQGRLPAAVRERHRRRRLAHDPAGLAAALRGLGLAAMPDLWPALPRLRVPVGFVAGELDTKFRLIGARLRDAVPGAQLHLVRNTGHDVGLEDPAALAALLTRSQP
jgi:2-succinyl-6-hydroxy-2,4-cyclohexadiene-1-carboxylate synthase